MDKTNDGGMAFPLEGYSSGMSLRAYLAAHETLSDIDDGLTESGIGQLIGRKLRQWNTDPIGNLIDEAEARAKLKFIRADAIIAELAKT